MSGGCLFDALRSAGLAPAKALDPSYAGQLQRYQVEGDKAGSRNGWLVAHGGPRPWAVFGSWKTGEQHHWAEAPRPGQLAETAEQRSERQRLMRAAEALRAQELLQVREAARGRAAGLWAKCRPASDAHGYCVRKGIKPYGARVLRDSLVIPARDTEGVLHTLQFIQADGGKTFLTGGRIRGCYFAIGRPRGRLLLCEGFATACSLFEATGSAVAACFSCGNLEPVALALRAKFPQLRMVICADNDIGTKGNPGLSAARAAARAVAGLVAVPVFEEGATWAQ